MTSEAQDNTNDSSGAPGGAAMNVAVWSAPRSTDYIEASVRESGIAVAGAGARDDVVRRQLGTSLGAPDFDDPRTGPVEHDAHGLLIADPEFDPQIHLRAGRLMGTVEPFAPNDEVGSSLHMLGEFIRTPGFLAAEQILESFGPIASVQVTSQCGPGQGTLFARLYDAMRVLERLCSAFEMVDAMLVGPNAAQSNEPVHAHVDAIPDALADLSGHLGVLVRHAPRAVSTISATDQSSWHRTAHLLGPGGSLFIDEAGVSWTGPSGQVLETHVAPDAPYELACRHLADEIRSLFGQPRRLPAVELSMVAYAACEAVRLSCRTRGPESTEKIRDVLERT